MSHKQRRQADERAQKASEVASRIPGVTVAADWVRPGSPLAEDLEQGHLFSLKGATPDELPSLPATAEWM